MAFLGSSHGPELGLLSASEPLSQCPLPYSVLKYSTISSVECQRLRNLYWGLPLVHHPPCGVSGLTQPNAHSGPRAKRVQSSCVCPPRAPELWQDVGSLPLPSSPYTHGPTCMLTHAWWPEIYIEYLTSLLYSLSFCCCC